MVNEASTEIQNRNNSPKTTKEITVSAKKPEVPAMSSLNLGTGSKSTIVEVESKSLIQKAQELFSIKNVINSAESKPLPPTSSSAKKNSVTSPSSP